VVAAIVIAVALVLVIVVGVLLAGNSSCSGACVSAHTGVVIDSTPVQTSPITVSQGALVVLFLSWVNFLAGGGGPTSITDTLNDNYVLSTSSGTAYNHTGAIYLTTAAGSDPSFVVTVLFAGGQATQGGSVAVAVVPGAGIGDVDGTGWAFGDGPVASVTLTTSHACDLVLLGTSGRGVSGPYAPGSGETLLDSGTATAGPFEDGIGYGTFSSVATGTSPSPSATLNTPTFWVAVGIAID
jgi:hypothetical protein